MPQFLGEETAETMLAALGEALDLVDCGFMLLGAASLRRSSSGWQQLTH